MGGGGFRTRHTPNVTNHTKTPATRRDIATIPKPDFPHEQYRVSVVQHKGRPLIDLCQWIFFSDRKIWKPSKSQQLMLRPNLTLIRRLAWSLLKAVGDEHACQAIEQIVADERHHSTLPTHTTQTGSASQIAARTSLIRSAPWDHHQKSKS